MMRGAEPPSAEPGFDRAGRRDRGGPIGGSAGQQLDRPGVTRVPHRPELHETELGMYHHRRWRCATQPSASESRAHRAAVAAASDGAVHVLDHLRAARYGGRRHVNASGVLVGSCAVSLAFEPNLEVVGDLSSLNGALQDGVHAVVR
jgi:hypothetical protein